ncbi:MAG: MFS transporter [Pseudomonadales bacterium]
MTDPNLNPNAVGSAGAERLANPLIWAYSLPRIGFGVMGLLFSTYAMKFSTDVLLIAPAAMGAILFASRLWDAVSDPLAGYLSDNTKSKYGRRRIWLFASAVPIGLGLTMIWSPPEVLEGWMLVAWMALAIITYETASTAFTVPHGALGIELTPNYHERTRLFGYIHMISSIGSGLGLLALYSLDSADDKREFARYLSAGAAIAVVILIIASTKILPERPDYQDRGSKNPYKSFSDVFKNPHSLLLLTVFAIETFGAASIGLLVPYMIDYVIPKDLMPLKPSLFMISVLISYVIPQVAFTPLWIKLASITGKKLLWTISLFLTSGCFVAYYFALDYPMMIWVISFVFGISSGIALVIEPSIKADIVDYDEYLTGERKEGAYYAVSNMVKKAAASLTAIVTGVVLQWTGFEPNAAQSPETIEALRLLFSILPACGYFFGGILFLKFSFNEFEHSEVRKVIAARIRAAQSTE